MLILGARPLGEEMDAPRLYVFIYSFIKINSNHFVDIAFKYKIMFSKLPYVLKP